MIQIGVHLVFLTLVAFNIKLTLVAWNVSGFVNTRLVPVLIVLLCGIYGFISIFEIYRLSKATNFLFWLTLSIINVLSIIIFFLLTEIVSIVIFYQSVLLLF